MVGMPNRLLSAIGLLIASSFTSCTLVPSGLETEEALLAEAGKPYAEPWKDRDLPELPDKPEWSDVLRRACLANGELEASYFQWAAAIHRVQQAGGYPNTPLSLGFEQMFQRGTSFDGTTIRIGPDAMENLSFPPKVYRAAKVALEDARAAGKGFTGARLDLQRRVLNAWFTYSLLAERIRIQEANLALLKLITETAIARVQAGAQQQDLLRAEVEQRRAEDTLRTLEAELPRVRTTLNALAARGPEAPLRPPERIPDPRPLALDDTTLLALAGKNNPELAALANRVSGREDALELARLRYIPDFNPFAGVTGSVSQVVGIGVSIPTFLPEVRGMVREAKAELSEVRAMYRQTTIDREAQVVAALYALRNSERQGRLFEERIVPAAERIVENARASYATGTGSFIDLIDAQRVLLDVRLVAAEARTAREITLADLEALVGVDLAGVALADTQQRLVTLEAVSPQLPFLETGDE
jgi:cobalt-zinc-cadmium efflux system outer membrane protein